MWERNTLRKVETRAAWKIVSYGLGRGKDQTRLIHALKHGLQNCQFVVKHKFAKPFSPLTLFAQR